MRDHPPSGRSHKTFPVLPSQELLYGEEIGVGLMEGGMVRVVGVVIRFGENFGVMVFCGLVEIFREFVVFNFDKLVEGRVDEDGYDFLGLW